MSKSDNVPPSTLHGYISVIESLHSGGTLTYKKIKDELEFLYGIVVSKEQIERYYDEDVDCKDCDEYVQYKNLGFI